eukprot:scaffold6792_cov35-Tisochrysis_lutea.AAC.1
MKGRKAEGESRADQHGRVSVKSCERGETDGGEQERKEGRTDGVRTRGAGQARAKEGGKRGKNRI